MNPQKRAAYVHKAALKAARKAIKRRDGKPLTRAELLELPVSTAPLWMHVVVALGATGALVAGIAMLVTLKSSIPGLLAIAGGVLLCRTAFGIRAQPLKSRLSSFDPGIGDFIFRSILESLN